MMKNIYREEKGFTLIEILVIAPVLMLVVMMAMSFLFTQFGQLTQQGAALNLKTEAQTATFSMQDDLIYASSFLNTMNPNLEDNYAPNGGWTADTSPNKTLLISTVALTKNRRHSDRSPVYVNTLGCTPDDVKEQNEELQNNIIYFVNGTNLYKRTITAPSSMNTCGTSYQTQTCPEANSGPSCKADRLITDKLDSIQYTFYDENNNVVTDPQLAIKVTVLISLKDRANAEDISANSKITVKRLNR